MRTEDGQIISKCLNGDKAAFGFLVDKYKASVYALAYYRLRNFEDAEDITQEVFVEAYQRLHTLKRWDSFSVWLYSITSNMCKEFLRSKSRRRDREFIADQKINIMRSNSLNSYHENKVYESLHEALDSLPETYQQVLTLYYLGGMNSEEIAQALGISPAAIRQRISRARSQLKEEILAMMGETFEQKKLSVSFTFRIVEAIKRVRVQPVSPKALPWGLSLATGIIISFLAIGQHFNVINSTGMMKGSPLPGMTRVLKIGEIPVDVVKISNAPIISSQRWNGTGIGSMLPNLQNALFMAHQGQGDTWTKKEDMPTARWGLSTCVVNGKIYAIGGEGFQGIFSTVEEYDPKTDTWTKKADMLTERYYLTACAVNGKIYAIGGTIAENVMDFSAVEEYDPVADKWTKKADMPTARHWLSASSVNGKIYAIGGLIAGNGHLSTVEEYDPAADKWTRKTDLPRRLHTLSTSIVDSKIYAIGGVDSGIIIPTVYEYDPLRDKWTTKADIPTKRWRVCTSTVNGKIYAIGGLDDTFMNNPNAKALPTIEEYDPVADKWTKKTDMPKPRADHACSAVGGKIYVFSGWGDDINDNIASSVLEYDTGFSSERIEPKGKLPTTWGDMRTASKR